MMNGFGHGWGMGWWWIIGILILILVIWLIAKAAQPRNRSDYPETGKNKSAMDILKERYARGEISREEFEERKKDLM